MVLLLWLHGLCLGTVSAVEAEAPCELQARHCCLLTGIAHVWLFVVRLSMNLCSSGSAVLVGRGCNSTDVTLLHCINSSSELWCGDALL